MESIAEMSFNIFGAVLFGAFSIALIGITIVGLVYLYAWLYKKLTTNTRRPKVNKHMQKEMDRFHQFVNDFERLISLIERYDTLKDDLPDWMKGGRL